MINPVGTHNSPEAYLHRIINTYNTNAIINNVHLFDLISYLSFIHQIKLSVLIVFEFFKNFICKM